MITEFHITAGEKRKRLDTFLVHREPEISRSRLQRLIELGRIRVNAQITKASQRIKVGDRITMDTPQAGMLFVNEEQIELDVLHEDDSLIVVNKPAQVVVHPTTGNWSGTLTNSLISHFQQTQQNQIRPGIVHRLDKGTSGIIVVAKTRQAHHALANQFHNHTITRVYDALTWEVPTKKHGIIDLPIGRDAKNFKKHSINTKTPKTAVTEYQVIEQFSTLASHIRLSPQTGRTHQLRVHLSSLGSPVLGDQLYGKSMVSGLGGIDIPRIMLHARSLGFQHPSTGIFQEYTANLPKDMQEIHQILSQHRTSLENFSPH